MKHIKDSNHSLIKAYLYTLYFSILTVLLAFLFALILNKYYPLSNHAVLLLESGGYVCWGTSLGALGAKYTSSSSENSVAILDRRLNFSISMLGIFVFTLAQFLRPTIG